MRSGTFSEICKVAFTFAGTLIGAGFASGQELLQFFIAYGSFGFMGILFAGVLFARLGYLLLAVSRARRLESYAELTRFLCGEKIGGFLEAAIALFLFIVLVVMLAAAGNVFADLFAAPVYLGRVLLAAAAVCAAAGGIGGIAKINGFVTPLLAAVIVMVSLSSLNYHRFSPEIFYAAASFSAQPAPHWLLSCALYVSYNLLLSAAVLVPLGKSARSAFALKAGSALGGLLIAVLSFFIVLTVLIHFPDILSAQIPMLLISCSQNALHASLYAAVFIIAMFTTTTVCLYGCAENLKKLLPLNDRARLLLATGAAGMLSDVGFSNLIAAAFPAFGYIGLYIFVRLVLAKREKI